MDLVLIVAEWVAIREIYATACLLRKGLQAFGVFKSAVESPHIHRIPSLIFFQPQALPWRVGGARAVGLSRRRCVLS
jgi:hypothetical protein